MKTEKKKHRFIVGYFDVNDMADEKHLEVIAVSPRGAAVSAAKQLKKAGIDYAIFAVVYLGAVIDIEFSAN